MKNLTRLAVKEAQESMESAASIIRATYLRANDDPEARLLKMLLAPILTDATELELKLLSLWNSLEPQQQTKEQP